jgi:hypothetical protein
VPKLRELMKLQKKIHRKVGVPVVKHHALKRGGNRNKVTFVFNPSTRSN